MTLFPRFPAVSSLGRRQTALAVLLILAAAASSAAGTAFACGFSSGSAGSLLAPGNPFPGVPPPAAGRQQTILAAPVGLFGPTVPTTCACGLGLGQTGHAPPAGVTVDRAFLTRLNTQSGQQTILAEFLPLNPSINTSDGLAIGPDQPFSGATWFGFSGRIQPFTVPLLRAGEIFTLAFAVSYPPGQRDQLKGLKVQFASGEGEPDGFPDYSGSHRVNFFAPGALPNCLPTQSVLCLAGHRFRADLKWKDSASGPLRPGKVAGVPTDGSGLFFFTDPKSFDALIKVINSCGENNRYWVFASAPTSDAVTITVTDTKANRTKQYVNPLGRPFPPVQDTNAFATCP